MSVTDRSPATDRQIELHELRHAAIKRAQDRDLGNLRLTSCFDGKVRLIFERGEESYWI